MSDSSPKVSCSAAAAEPMGGTCLAPPESDIADLDARDVAGQHGPQGPSEAQRAQLRLSLQDRLNCYLLRGRARVVLTDNVYAMVTVKYRDGIWTFRVHHMFASGPPIVVRALARYAEAKGTREAAVLRDYVAQHEHLVRRRTRKRARTLDVQGRYFNLQEVFERLNLQYFGGRIQAKITWGRRQKRTRPRGSMQLGSYAEHECLIRIHPVLDAADVPGYFLEWVVYHEMLHEVHEMPVVGGRRIVHTREFRAAEAEFKHYARAVAWERSHAHTLLAR